MLRVTLQAWMHRELKEMIGNETALKEKSGVLVPEGRMHQQVITDANVPMPKDAANARERTLHKLRPVNYCRPTGA